MQQFMSFEKFITPAIIQVLYWIITVLIVVAGVFTLFSEPVGGIMMIILGPIAVRVYAEVILLMFKIHSTLVDIKEGMAGKPMVHATAAPVVKAEPVVEA